MNTFLKQTDKKDNSTYKNENSAHENEISIGKNEKFIYKKEENSTLFNTGASKLILQDSGITPPDQSDSPSDPEEKILHLNDSNFYPTIAKGIYLVLFQAPWCAACKRMKREYNKAAIELIADGRASRLASIDCTDSSDVCEEFEIAGFPTMKLFKDGTFVKDFTGKRTKEEFKAFMLEAETA